MIKKIDVLLPRISQYEVIHHFDEKLYEAFKRAGIKTRLLKKEQFEETFIKSPPDATIGFNGAPRTDDGVMLCDIYKIPHISLLLDPPYRFPYLIESSFVHIGCDDKVCCKILRDRGFERTFFFPHGVEKELSPDPKIEKIYDIVMLATFIDFEQIRNDWPQKYDKKIVEALCHAADETFTNKNRSFITAFEENYKGHFDWIELSEPLQELELYIKGKDRTLLVESFEGITLHIFGASFGKKGWKDYLGKKHPSIYVHNPLPYREALDIMRRTKVLLNPSLKNKDGAHERLFSGISCGAMVVTPDSRYLRETLNEGDGVIYYDHQQPDEYKKAVEHYLQNDHAREQAILKGYGIIQKHHTWDQRVNQLLKLYTGTLGQTQSDNFSSVPQAEK